MADENSDGEGKEKGKGNNMVVIIAIVALLAGGAGAAAFFSMKSGGEASAPVIKKALFHDLKPFVISLTGDRRSRYIQLELAIMTREESMLEILTDNRPLIRNELIGFTSGMTYQDALLPETPERLRNGSLKRIQAILAGQGGELLEDVMVVNFVIQ